MTPDVVALTRPLDRVTARIRVVAAEEATKDAQEREHLALCQPSILASDLHAVSLRLRNARMQALIDYSAALRERNPQKQDEVLYALVTTSGQIAAELEMMQTQAVRAARIRVESFTARVRAHR